MENRFKPNSDFIYIDPKSIPVESENSITVAEHYHYPILRSYHNITTKAPDIDK